MLTQESDNKSGDVKNHISTFFIDKIPFGTINEGFLLKIPLIFYV